MRFVDRTEAGIRLADRIRSMQLDDPFVLGLPRGGVPVAFAIATEISAPLDVFVARRVNVPGQHDYGIGAIAEGVEPAAERDALGMSGVSPKRFADLAAAAHRELERQVRHYRQGRPLPHLEQHDVVVVDDGLATGITAHAALLGVRALRPRRLILAIPACAPESADRLRSIADGVCCLIEPSDYRTVGQWYDNFDQTTDSQVVDLLDRARKLSGTYDDHDELWV